MNSKKFLFSCLILVFSINTQAQDLQFDSKKLDKFLSLIEDNNKGMGSLSIFKDGKEVYQKTIGLADVENKIKADQATIYRIGSISKTFTASIIMQMINEKKLTLDTKLDQYFPKIENAEKITIKQMLSHQSGIFNFTGALDYMIYSEKPITRAALVEKIISYGSSFKPGEKNAYSNSNYVLLSLIAEKIDEKSFGQILKDRIATPNNLSSTYHGGKINSKNHEAYSYTILEDWRLTKETNMSIPLGAGAVVSTSTDLNLFFSALFSGKIIPKNLVKEMKTIENDYGLGLFQYPYYDQKIYGHTGGIDGFNSMSAYFLDEKVSISYISNGTVMPVNDIIVGALNIYFRKEYELPSFKPSFEVTSKDLDQYLGTYSSPSFGLKVTITKKGNKLMGQATGQAAFPLEAFEKNKFKFDPAGIKLEFEPKVKKMTLKQGGAVVEMTKE